MMLGLIDAPIIVSFSLFALFVCAIVAVALLKRWWLNVTAAFLLCEWLIPSLLVNFGVPQVDTRLAIFALFVIGLLADASYRRGRPRDSEVRCPWCEGAVPKDALVCMHCARDKRLSPNLQTFVQSSPSEVSATEEPAGPSTLCRYCGKDGSDVKGLYGQAYHRICHAHALST